MTLRQLKEEKLRRLKQKYYQQNPSKWLSERFLEEEKNVVWSAYDNYENHEWDGSKDPFAQGWSICK